MSPRTVRAYAITSEAVARERERVGGDPEDMDISKVVQLDKIGFPKRIWAYDQPESVGWYGEEAVVGDWQLIKAPLDSGLNLWEIAALPLRAPTAYHMWRRALGMYRLKVPVERQAIINVLGFGGGVSELFLMLARSERHNAYFRSGSPARPQAL